MIRQAVTRWVGADVKAPNLEDRASLLRFWATVWSDEGMCGLVVLCNHVPAAVGWHAVDAWTPKNVFAIAIREACSSIVIVSPKLLPDDTVWSDIGYASEVLGIPILEVVVLIDEERP